MDYEPILRQLNLVSRLCLEMLNGRLCLLISPYKSLSILSGMVEDDFLHSIGGRASKNHSQTESGNEIKSQHIH
jgi:hypothetical protein